MLSHCWSSGKWKKHYKNHSALLYHNASLLNSFLKLHAVWKLSVLQPSQNMYSSSILKKLIIKIKKYNQDDSQPTKQSFIFGLTYVRTSLLTRDILSSISLSFCLFSSIFSECSSLYLYFSSNSYRFIYSLSSYFFTYIFQLWIPADARMKKEVKSLHIYSHTLNSWAAIGTYGRFLDTSMMLQITALPKTQSNGNSFITPGDTAESDTMINFSISSMFTMFLHAPAYLP